MYRWKARDAHNSYTSTADLMDLIDDSLYSAVLRTCSFELTLEGASKTTAALKFTPLGASAAFCNQVNTWASSTESLVPSASDDLSRESLVHLLFQLIKDVNDDLLESLRVLNWERRVFARAAFMDIGHKDFRTDGARSFQCVPCPPMHRS